VDLEDFAEPEVGIAIAVAAAATAAAASPKVRRVVRRGAVYGLAGLLIAKDKVTAAARGLAGSARQAVASARGSAGEAAQPSGAAGR
jgi:hypothetical protein